MSSQGPQFGENQFTPEERAEIQRQLDTKLSKDQIATRAGPGGCKRLFLDIDIHIFTFHLAKVSYLETWRAIEIANHIFGYNGWSSSVINLSQDYVLNNVFFIHLFTLIVAVG